MPLKIYDGSSYVAASPKIWDGSAWIACTNGKIWDGSAWVSFYSAISVSIPDLSEGGTGGTHTFIDPLTIGIIGSYTTVSYVWSVVGSDVGTFTIVSGQGTASVVVKVAGAQVDGTSIGTYQCIATIDGTDYTTTGHAAYARSGSGG